MSATLLTTGRLVILCGLFTTTLVLFYHANSHTSFSHTTSASFLDGANNDEQQHFAPQLHFIIVNNQTRMSKTTTTSLSLVNSVGQQQQQQQQPSKSNLQSKVDATYNISISTTKSQGTSNVLHNNNNNNKETPKRKPLNIMILYPDDWRHDSIGIAKTQPVFTPFLDSLAQNEAIRFTHNCVTTSVCWISRATLLTGQYWSRHRSESLNRPVFYDHWNTTWPYLLQKHGGYYIGHVGKWQYHQPDFVRKHYNYAKVYEGFHWSTTKEGLKIHATDMTRNDTLHFLRKRPKDRPFAITVAFYPPKAIGYGSEQWFPKPEMKNLYQNMTIPEPIDWNASFYKLPDFFHRRGKNEGRMRWKQRFGNYTLFQNSMKSYYALITQVDDACREIVHELKRQGIYNDTLLIFTTDNGFFHGEHGLAGKWFPYQESIRVPLILRDPRMSPHLYGTTDDSFTLNIDLAPTILAAANLSPLPSSMQGRDIAELYLESQQSQSQLPWRQEFFYEHPSMGRLSIPASSALVRKDYKYMYYREHKVERLFDLINDPLENDDIKYMPQYASLLQEMRQRHGELQQQVK